MDFKSPSRLRSAIPLRAGLLLLIAIAGIHCDEALPPVVEPKDVLSGDIALNVGANGFVLLTAGSGPVGTDGAVAITIRNLYNEVLSDSEAVQVEAVVYQTSHPERRVTVLANRDALQDPSMLISYLLAIPPTKPLKLLAQWSHTFSGDSSFISVADKDTVFQEKGVEVKAYKVLFTLSARVKLFKKYQTLIIKERPFTVYYRWSTTGSG